MIRFPLAMMALWALASPAFGRPVADGAVCRIAAHQAERAAGIPAHLLSAIARVESGRRDPMTSRFAPWPWTINVEGQGFFFNTKAEGIAAVRRHQLAGARSIDVGCMQINLLHHPTAFSGLEQAFDPASNAAYAARFLLELKAKTGDWQKAAAFYHSQTPERADDYQRRVLAAWPEEIRLARGMASPATAQAWMQGHQSGGAPPGWGAYGGALLSNRVDRAQVLSAGAGRAPRALAAYRAAPIALASRPLPPRVASPPRRF